MSDRELLINKYLNSEHFIRDNINFLCGDLIGRGQFRDVFQYQLDPKFVVKIQNKAGDFNNILEFEIWQLAKYTIYAKYFAQCSWISTNGRIMLQAKTQPITEKRPAPADIPAFFTDVKDDNFGWIGKNFVAHDYDLSLVRFMFMGLNKRTRKYKDGN